MKLGALLLVATLLAAACGEKPAEKKGAPPTLITTTQAQAIALEVSERTLGSLEAVNDPKIGAEIAGKVAKIAARAGEAVSKGQLLAQIDPTDAGHQANVDSAEIARLQALLAQQERVLTRQTELVQKSFISKNALDEATAQRDALKSQLASAEARAGLSRNNVDKTRVVAPFAGIIEEQIAAAGDYVKLGDPLFRLVSNARLRAHLPFPESAAPRLTVGMPLRIASP
ncbi:MAG: efflux RND transporter periplasmic adaptor subunit, partial [Azonexus sp.]